MKRIFTLTAALVLGVALMAGPALAKNLVVAHDTNFKPFEFKDETTGEYTGFDIELWKEIAARLNLEYKMQPMDFNGIIPGLQTAQVDVGIAGMTITEERGKVVDFSDPYYDSGLSILVRADDDTITTKEDLEGKVVATKLGTSSPDFLKANVNTKELKLFPNNDGMFFELLAGRADAAFFDLPVVQEYASTAGKDKVKVVGPVYEGQSYGIAFPKGSELRDKVNEALKEIKADGTYEQLYIKWFGEAPKSK
jgi:glutamine transport system substrate-binding protein